MTRIALLVYSTKPRGSVVHTLELAEALHALGQQVCVYALDKDGKGFERLLRCDYELIPALPVPEQEDEDWADALIRQRIAEFTDYFSHKQPQYDIYHAQDCISANALYQLRTRGFIPHFVRTVHHIDEFNSIYLQQCQERSIREPDLCLCVSDRPGQELQQQYQIYAPRVINGVDSQRFSPIPNGSEQALLERLGLREPVYLTVGGIEPRKNSIRLLQAFIEVLNDYPQAQLVIAGGETLFDYQAYRDEFFALVNSAGIKIGQSLILPGVIPESDLPTLYRCADAFVFPSLKEGWGLVVLEAIASGIPVITANQPPFTEFLGANQALLIDPFSPADLAQAMRDILQRGSERLVEQSRSIIDQYSWERSAQLHLNYYQQLLMPEIHFQIKWPDGSQQACYSPSLIVKDYFTPGQAYELEDFLERSRTALQIASDRVQAKYGMPCSRALSQLQQLEAKANQYRQSEQVHFLQFKEGSA